ncbi:hypothetical protein RvY_17498 [Ramazzottius varieornatus]|uniref:Uncharacterized protein n=1 Tax=Ramazzottius varieornatus TaxID=947166 RepID=A0A1D1W2A7_RAMVA|nr:hypothetical protein RvY_17498 [Ramazzottius varieornatus]
MAGGDVIGFAVFGDSFHGGLQPLPRLACRCCRSGRSVFATYPVRNKEERAYVRDARWPDTECHPDGKDCRKTAKSFGTNLGSKLRTVKSSLSLLRKMASLGTFSGKKER